MRFQIPLLLLTYPLNIPNNKRILPNQVVGQSVGI